MEINGEILAKEILLELKEKRTAFGKLILAIFVIGEDKEKLRFLTKKEMIAKELDVDLRIYKIDPRVGRKKIRKQISQVIKHKTITAGLIQLPIPDNLPKQYFLNTIPPEKDIDCLSAKTLGKFYVNQSIIRPTAVEVVNFLKNKYQFDFSGKVVTIVGYGNLIGKPLTHYLCQEKATVIVLNEKTKEPEKYFQQSDFIISGAGVPYLVNDCKEEAVLIDFGTTVIENKVVGDIDIGKIKKKAKFYTPTPGGTGPLTIAMLFQNLFKLAALATRKF